MTGAQVQRWCRRQPAVSEEVPFGPEVTVFKVGGKMFAVLPEHRLSVTLKCDPRYAEVLRARHPAVRPGYHTNKRHWNTVSLDGSLPPALVRELLEHSYTLVVDSLPRRLRAEL